MIALIAQATQERAQLPKEKRLPTLLYIDEAADYFDEGGGLEELLNTGRKYQVGVTFAHQNLGQLPRKLKDTVMASTAMKIVGGLSRDDRDVFARVFDLPPEALGEVWQNTITKTATQSTFCTYYRDWNPPTGSTIAEFGVMERKPKMTAAEQERLLADNRERYCAPPEQDLIMWQPTQATEHNAAAGFELDPSRPF